MNTIEKNSVLIVDDEKSNLEVLIHILSPEYTVYMTKNGSSAIEMANKFLPDIILLDVLMPGVDGYEVLAELKASEKTRNIPVIFITGLNKVEDEEKGLDMDAADYIHKPFSAKIVKSRVRNQIQIVNQIRELFNMQKKLEAAAKAAEAANQAKSIFLAKMSHEIRTPLNVILGISEIQLQKGNLPQDIKESYIRIFNSGDLLLNIINDILDMSKIEAGKFKLSPARYDVANLIHDTVFYNMIKYGANSVEFYLNVDENVPSMLFGDDLRIKQVLNNFLSNAFKYTKEGKVELSIVAENSDDVVTLIFRVSDTGQGMTKEQLGKLFEEYSRFNLETNRMTEGTGLGMNIVRNLVLLMNGEIFVESEPEKGSLFTVRLPQGNIGAPVLGKDAVEKLRQFRPNYETKMEISKIKHNQILSGKVLLVDDMDMNLYVAKDMLTPYGLQIDMALSGFEAIDKIKNNKYDIVFMDHMMPMMDGVETTHKIRELGEEYKKLPIVALTANAISGAKEMFLANGFNGFLSKPIRMQEFDEIIKQWIPPEKISSKTDLGTPKNSSPASETKETREEICDSFLDKVVQISEINIEVGLTRFSNMKDMYCSTLDLFYKNVISKCHEMAVFLEAKDLKNFCISSHGIKSSLSMIGALGLSDVAHGMENASKNQDIDYCIKHFPEFKKNFLSLCDKLSDIFSGTDIFSEE